jgi:hypothetical protein
MTRLLSQRGTGREAADGARLASAAAASEALETLRATEREEHGVDTVGVASDVDRFEVSRSASDAELEVGELEIDRPQAMILVPTAAQHAPQHGQTAGDSPGRRPPAPVLQEIVEFAELHREKDGRCEFHLGLDRKKFKGAEIRVSSHGKRRIGLRIEKSEVIGQSNVDALVEALTERNIEIVEVVMN